MKIKRILLFSLFLASSLLFSQSLSDTAYIGTSKATEKIYSMKQKYGKDVSELIAKNIIEYDMKGISKVKYLYQSNDTYTGKIEYHNFPPQKMNEEVEYNAMNQVIEKRRMQILFTDQDFIQTNFDGQGGVITKTESIYDSTAHKRTETNYNTLGTIETHSVFKTDDNGRDLEKHFFDYDGYNTLNSTYSYDDSGKLEETKNYDEQGKLTDTMVYQYDNEGHLTNVGYYREDGFQFKREAYIYDKRGRLLEYDQYESSDDVDGALRLVGSMKYEFTMSKK